MLLAFALAGVVMFAVLVAMFGPLGILGWLFAMAVTYWYAKKKGWI